MPAPAHRMRSARLPCGHSSTAMSPPRYFFSSALLLPRNDSTRRSTCPAATSGARPPLPSTPALLDTHVSECRSAGPRRCSAVMMVSVARQSQYSHSSRPNLAAVSSDETRQHPRERYIHTCNSAQSKARAQDDRPALDVRDRLVRAGVQLRLGPVDLGRLGALLVRVARGVAPHRGVWAPTPRRSLSTSRNCG